MRLRQAELTGNCFFGLTAPLPGSARGWRGFDPATGTAFGGRRLTRGLRSGGSELGRPPLDAIIGADQVSSAGAQLPPTTPGTFAVAGLVDGDQFQAVIRTLSQVKEADILARPAVVTKSGQKAHVERVRELMYPTEYDPPELPQTVRTQQGGAGGFPVTPANPTAFTVRRVGLLLDVDPVIAPGGMLVDLNLAPEFVRFED